MISEFLSACQAALPEEREDFEAVQRYFWRNEGCFTALMPAITQSFYPIYALECTSARRYARRELPQVFLVPVGGNEGWGLYDFEQSVKDFYELDEFREEFGLELEEMILLRCPGVEPSLCLDGELEYQAVYIRLTAENGTPVHLLALPLDAGALWREIVERYEIPCDMVIESHKGMGNWFEYVPLYEDMRTTARPELRPRYYFRGLRISREPGHGFMLDYTIPEQICHESRVLGNWEKEIYRIHWDETVSYR